MDVEANSNRSSFCLATLRCKRRSGTSDASRSLKKRSMIGLESQSQAMRLKNSRLGAMLAIASFYHSLLGFASPTVFGSFVRNGDYSQMRRMAFLDLTFFITNLRIAKNKRGNSQSSSTTPRAPRRRRRGQRRPRRKSQRLLLDFRSPTQNCQIAAHRRTMKSTMKSRSSEVRFRRHGST